MDLTINRSSVRRAFTHLRRILPPPAVVLDLDAEGLSCARRAEIDFFFDAARRRLDGATQLRESGNAIPALVLYREGFLMLAKAYAASSDEEAAPADSNAQAIIHRFIDSLPPSYSKLARSLRENLLVSSSSGAADVDALPRRELERRVQELSAVTPRFLALLAPQTAARRKALRTWRRAAVFSVMATCVGVFVATVRSPENIALHKPATSSSVAWDTAPAGVVNGKVYEPFGFHSDTQDSAWLRIDLGRRYLITEARIHGRHDCCFDQSIPIAFEGSDDGEKFRMIAERKNAFEQVHPWVILPGSAKARYVRLRTLKSAPLVLSEVEVNGKPVE